VKIKGFATNKGNYCSQLHFVFGENRYEDKKLKKKHSLNLNLKFYQYFTVLNAFVHWLLLVIRRKDNDDDDDSCNKKFVSSDSVRDSKAFKLINTKLSQWQHFT